MRDLDVSEENIKRIKGEEEHVEEEILYYGLLKYGVNLRNDFTEFEWIFMGIGEEGYVESIFHD